MDPEDEVVVPFVVDEEVASTASDSSSSESSSSDSEVEAKAPKKAFNRLTFHADDVADVLQEELAQLTSTSKCDLHNTQLKAIPPELLSPMYRNRLTKLTLGSNRITDLPSSLFELQQSLIMFDCQSNALTDLPTTLMTLPHLQTLLLDYNGLTSLPTSDIDPSRLLPSLTTLGVEWNDLREFPSDLVRHCKRLEQLFITENEHVCATNVPKADVFSARGADASMLTIKLDNRPRVVSALAFIDGVPGIKLQWNTIYPDRVLSHLYLGSVRTAQCLSVYQDFDIRYVLTAAKEVEARIEPGMKHLVLLIDDVPGEDIRPVFDKSFAFIEEARANDCGVLIHCFAGRSRSVTVTVAYLMRGLGISRDAALAYVRSCRPSAQPNEGFMRALAKYDDELRATRPTVEAIPPTHGETGGGWQQWLKWRAS